MSIPVVSSPALYLGGIALLSPLIFAYAIVFIPTASVFQRASIFTLSIAAAAHLQYSVPAFTGNGTYDGMTMSLLWIFHLRAFDVLLLKAIYLPPAAATTKEQRSPSPTTQSGLYRLFTAYSLLFNFRNIHTPHNTSSKPPPPFSIHPEYIPNRPSFLKQRVLQTLTTYLLLDAIFFFLPAPNPEIDIPEGKQQFFSRLGDVSLEEVIARPITVVLPAASIYGIFTVAYNLASIAAVLFGWSEPRDWPPLFGSFGEAYTLRRFWGVTWHQLLRSSLESSTSFLTMSVLHVPPRWKLLSRSLRLVLAFAITGLIHIPGIVILGESAGAPGVMEFFVMQAVGIMVESAALYVWAAVTGRDGPARKRDGTLTGMGRMVGFVWVLAWTAWTGPAFTWVVARKLVRGRDDVVPWSFIAWVMGGKR